MPAHGGPKDTFATSNSGRGSVGGAPPLGPRGAPSLKSSRGGVAVCKAWEGVSGRTVGGRRHPGKGLAARTDAKKGGSRLGHHSPESLRRKGTRTEERQAPKPRRKGSARRKGGEPSWGLAARKACGCRAPSLKGRGRDEKGSAQRKGLRAALARGGQTGGRRSSSAPRR